MKEPKRVSLTFNKTWQKLCPTLSMKYHIWLVSRNKCNCYVSDQIFIQEHVLLKRLIHGTKRICMRLSILWYMKNVVIFFVIFSRQKFIWKTCIFGCKVLQRGFLLFNQKSVTWNIIYGSTIAYTIGYQKGHTQRDQIKGYMISCRIRTFCSVCIGFLIQYFYGFYIVQRGTSGLNIPIIYNLYYFVNWPFSLFFFFTLCLFPNINNGKSSQ